MFGGSTVRLIPPATAVSNSTWLWSGGGWINGSGVLKPSARSSHTMLFDTLRKQVVMFGDANSATGATWSWNGTAWSERVNTQEPALVGGALGWDPERQKAVWFGGHFDAPQLSETWTWDGNLWSPVLGNAPPAGSGQMLVWDAERKQLVQFGGLANGNTYLDETWVWNGVFWQKLAVGVRPPGRAEQSMTWDPDRKQVVLFGGIGAQGKLGDTWLWDGTKWTPAVSPTAPAPRTGHSVTYDVARRTLVLFGGEVGNNDIADTWLWTGVSWRLAVDAVSAGPVSRKGQSMAYDPQRRRHVLLTGIDNPQGRKLGETWLLYLRGGGCSASTECGSGACVDGVCCEAAACGTCETCAGPKPGTCTPVTRADDPDTCASKDQRSCDAAGRCTPGAGVLCTKNSDCASGYCADGVCCDGACNRACEACSAQTKLTGRDDGRCGPARIASNPRALCTDNAVCGAQGNCERAPTCRDDHTAIDGQGKESGCGVYRCKEGTCLQYCKDIGDCIPPSVCGADGACMRPSEGQAAGAAGCCASTAAAAPAKSLLSFAACTLLMVGTVVRRFRRKSE
jgi:hypothetical protein